MGVEKAPGVEVHPNSLWAAQFFAAHVNGDNDTTLALFTAHMDDPHTHAGGVIALLGMCADVVRDYSGADY
jgi:hypothetical protein